jgi:hypothetical protein
MTSPSHSTSPNSTNSNTGITKQAVADKFAELHKKHYVDRGYMITTVNDDAAKKFVEEHPEIEWTLEYNKYAEAEIQTAKIHVTIFGKPFTVLLERPMCQVHRSEFEYYFGFGGHCSGFTQYRMIVRFATTNEEHGFDYRTLLEENIKEKENDTQPNERVDIPYIQDVFKLLVIGGYVKYWKAWDELTQWFIEHLDDETVRTWLQTESQREKSEKNCLSTINKYVFDNISTMK